MEIKTKFKIEDKVWIVQSVKRICNCCTRSWFVYKTEAIKAEISYISVGVDVCNDMTIQYDAQWEDCLDGECSIEDIAEKEVFTTREKCRNFIKTLKTAKLCTSCQNFINKL